MKSLIFLFLFSVLLQNCYSYKSIGYNNNNIDKNQKIKIIKLDKTRIKGQFVSKNENEILIGSSKNGQLLTIPNAEIESNKIREYSALKTIITIIAAIPVVVIGVQIIIIMVSFLAL